MLGVGAEGARGCQKVALGSGSAAPSRRGKASSALPGPETGPRTTCCCPGALRPSPRKFTPRRAHPGRLGHPVNPDCPGESATAPAQARDWELLGAQWPAEWQPGPRLGCRRPGGDPALAGARGCRAGGCEERAPRRTSSPRWGWRRRGSSPDRHDSRLPQYLEAARLSHLGCGTAPLPSTAPAPATGGTQTSSHQRRGLGQRRPACSPHSSGTPGWDTGGPTRAPRPRAGGQQPPPGRARWLGQPPARPVPSASANRYGGVVAGGPRQPRALGTAQRGEDRGKRRGRERAGGGTHLWLGRGRPRGPAAPKPGFRGAEARAGGFLRGPQGGGGARGGAGGQRSASRSHPPRGAAAPRRHSRGRRLPRRPGPLPKRAPGPARAPLRLGARSGRAPPVLVLGSRLGTLPRTPGSARSSTPPAPAGRAEPRRAGSAHVRGCRAAPRSPVAEAPPELRALETPCSSGLLPGSSPAGPPGP